MYTDSLLSNALYFLTAAVIAVPLFRALGLGSILGYLFAGILLGPGVLGIVDDPEELLHFAEYGVILLLFLIGLELAPEKLWSMRNQIMLTGGSQLLLSAGLLAGFFLLLDLGPATAIVLGLALGLSSTAFAIQLMSEEHILATPLGRKGFSILLLQDLAVIPILLLVGLLAQAGNAEEGPPWYVGLAAVAGVLVFGQFGLNRILRIVADSQSREVMTAASLLIVIGVAVLMDVVGLSMGLGAFLAGIMLANSNYRHQLESDIEPFKGILLGLFFIAVGMSINLGLLLSEPLLMLGAAIALVLLKTLIIVGILRMQRISWREGFQLGLMLSQGGEFAFVVLSQATGLGLFDGALADRVTLVVGLSMALTSPLVVAQRRLWHGRSESQPDQDAHWDSHEPEVIIAGFGRFGQVVGRMLTASHIPFTALDKNPAHVEFVQQFGNRLFYGDLTRMDILESAGIREAKILVVAADVREHSLKIVDLARELNPNIKIVARAIDRFHAYELHNRKANTVIRETFPSSLEAATSTLEFLGFTEFQALAMQERFRQHDEDLLQRSVGHKDDLPELLNIAREGRKELQALFEEDRKKPISA
ncbi:MAG: monovalent cation:proton antiporter-2 (CPA2) family protein [Pseudohongiellaceae bacterium]